MQIDIRTDSVKPVRQTFANIARRLGADKPATRYQEAMYDLQPETSFHYRPLCQPEYELYDKRRTAVVMADWYALKDPRQFYYGTYVNTRARQQESMEKNLEFLEQRGLLAHLPDDTRQLLTGTVVALRHVEWAAPRACSPWLRPSCCSGRRQPWPNMSSSRTQISPRG